MPAVVPETMTSKRNDDGSVTLSWQVPPGFDSSMFFRVVLRSDTQDIYPDQGYDNFLYAGGGTPDGISYSLTISKYVGDYVRKNYSPGQGKWLVETRKNNLSGVNISRTLSVMKDFPY